ncbi:unnamed protein product [Rotaria sordida]|uniref:Uncharacterized protein n=1 Tax=Rotaria sordida TaxID=392033 RepID=A0A815GFG2_9BILA|nr:unnamed protein product [Rotaria sordida]
MISSKSLSTSERQKSDEFSNESIFYRKTTDDSKRIHIIYIAVVLTSCTLVVSILLAVENIYILYDLFTNHRMVLNENTISDSTVKRSKKISACFTIKAYIHKIIR